MHPLISDWPVEAQEAAQLVIDKYGEPHEFTPTLLIWNNAGEWKRVLASRALYHHEFPAPHTDSVESVINYQVPANLIGSVVEFDGSVVVERTAGEASARCHDEEANRLALNLMDDIVTGVKSVAEARAYYVKEFLDYRRKKPTPYMDELRFRPSKSVGDPDQRQISDDELAEAEADGVS